MWMVRAGEKAKYVDEFIDKNIIAVSWLEMGDISKLNTLDELKQRAREKYIDASPALVNNIAGQIFKFLKIFNIGDKVLTYNPSTREYHYGEITGDYEYNPQMENYPNTRKVEWMNTFSRDDLSTQSRYSLGAISTIFEIPTDVEKEIESLLSGNHPQLNEIAKTEIMEDELETIEEDIVSKSYELIKDKIIKLSWQDMQELMAGILRAMGYQTRISPPGPDGGVDIFASPDGLGLEEPRIRVEVKHRPKDRMSAPHIRSFLGGFRPGDKGIYLSNGGYSKDARLEADRASYPLTLLDLDDLVELIIKYYDKFDIESRSLVPLKKYYWPK